MYTSAKEFTDAEKWRNEMSDFNVLKRNRKYFAATKSGYKCKILIDSNSESLEIGEQVLAVDDISVKTKYGNDLVFKLSAPADEQKEVGICTLVAPYNSILVDRCRELGGKWDRESGAWVFPAFVSDEVEELDFKYNSEMVVVEISVLRELTAYRDSVEIAGFAIAEASGRDTDAKLAPNIAMIAGGAISGGSVKNWCTIIVSNTVIRMSMPRGCLVDIGDAVEITEI